MPLARTGIESQRIFEALEAVIRARAPEAVTDELARFGAQVGFPRFPTGILPNSRDLETPSFFYTNWDPAWLEHYRREKLVEIDPVPLAAARSINPLTMAAIESGRGGIAIARHHRRVIAEGKSAGYRDGLVIPIHGPRGYPGVAAFQGDRPSPDKREALMLHMLGLAAHHRPLDVHGGLRAVGRAPPLSVREQDALAWALAGNTDSEIAAAMGITVRTVRFHFDGIRRKLGCQTRLQAVARAVALGLVDP